MVQTASKEQGGRKDAAGEDGSRERRFIVSWMRQQLSQRQDLAEKEAFLSKHKYVLIYHGIKKEEILD